jgi:hypothetical protein
MLAHWLSRAEHGAQPVSVERPEPSVLSLEVPDLPHRYNAFERLYRPVRDPLRAGDRVVLPELTALVDAASDGPHRVAPT